VPCGWQKINGLRHDCHWWQEIIGQTINAMSTVMIFLALIALGAILVRYARNDRFAGPGSRAPRIDELGIPHDQILRRLG
jgi:hypothetical protein